MRSNVLGTRKKKKQWNGHPCKRRWPCSSLHTSNNYLSLFYHCLICVFEMPCNNFVTAVLISIFFVFSTWCQSVLIGYPGCWWSSVTCHTNWATSCRHSQARVILYTIDNLVPLIVSIYFMIYNDCMFPIESLCLPACPWWIFNSGNLHKNINKKPGPKKSLTHLLQLLNLKGNLD